MANTDREAPFGEEHLQFIMPSRRAKASSADGSIFRAPHLSHWEPNAGPLWARWQEFSVFSVQFSVFACYPRSPAPKTQAHAEPRGRREHTLRLCASA